MNRVQIEDWLFRLRIKNYIINDNGVVDVEGDVDLYNRQLTAIPVQFGYVSGNFHCNYNLLTSLKGSPREVGGDFYCGGNLLTSLRDGPREVGGVFLCSGNKMQTRPDHSFINIGGGFGWLSGRESFHI